MGTIIPFPAQEHMAWRIWGQLHQKTTTTQGSFRALPPIPADSWLIVRRLCNISTYNKVIKAHI